MIVLYVLIGCLMLYYFWSQRRFYWLAWKMKGTYIGLPLVGQAYVFSDSNKIIETIGKIVKKFGTPFHFWLGPRLLVVLNKPEHMEIVLNSPDCVGKGKSYRFMEPILGYGLITSKGEHWRTHRKLLNSSFYYNVINDFFPIFNRNINTFLSILEKKANTEESFDMLEPLKWCSLDMIFETTMNQNIEAQTNTKNNAFIRAIYYTLEVAGMRMFQVWIQPQFLFKLSKLFKKYATCLKLLNENFENILTDKVDQFQKQKSGSLAQPSADDKKSTFIDRVMGFYLEQNVFTREDLMSEIKTIIMAGYETTANSTAYVLLLLGMYPKIQERVFNEIKSAIPNRNVDLKPDDLKNLPYLDRVIKEVLRVCPAVPLLTRLANADVKIDDHIIPAGTEFIMTVFQMQRSKEYWTHFDPDEFNPDNFLPENLEGKHPFTYIPFSAGSRNCIGMRYGSILLKLITVNVIQNFILSSDLKLNEMQFRMNITLILLNKHLVKMRRREIY